MLFTHMDLKSDQPNTINNIKPDEKEREHDAAPGVDPLSELLRRHCDGLLAVWFGHPIVLVDG